jgi:hypothetical protein
VISPAAKRGKRTCQALDINGYRCRRRAVERHKYHGENELYLMSGDCPPWVLVELCAICSRDMPRAVAEKGDRG